MCRNLEEAWLQEYHTIGDQIAEYGPKGNRSNVRGSPVVPGSSRKILEEGDALLYTVTVLKGQYQPGRIDKEGTFEQGTVIDYVEDFKTRAREKKFIVRDFVFDQTSQATNEEAIAELEVEVDRLWSGLIRWCKAHFGETFIAWMHIKVRSRLVLTTLLVPRLMACRVDANVDGPCVCGVGASLWTSCQLCRGHVQSTCKWMPCFVHIDIRECANPLSIGCT